MNKYGVKTQAEGKYHLVTEETEKRLEDPKYNTAPLGDKGYCGRLDANDKYARVLGLDSMIPSALCQDCKRLQASRP